MNSGRKKSEKVYAILFLASYLFLTALTTLHYHHIEMGKDVSYSSSPNTPALFDNLSDTANNCTIQLFSGTILALDFIPGAVHNYTNSRLLQECTQDNLPGKPTASNNQLRAPPCVI